ncbi:sugar phosphate isomerase/epimerase [Desulfovibrio sp. OttesenSCG-928-O18]|nr:sugar phosphate isomerase/epimerase [Desulfovibrio sp. OttesenSCG-928-O18]
MFFETQSSLLYGRQDLPVELASLGLEFHVHLPLDLPWGSGGGAVAAVCLELMGKVDFLDAAQCVLHPPKESGAAEALEAFARRWRRGGRNCADVLLENIRENDLLGLLQCMDDNGFGLCLDLGHMLAYEQHGLAALLPERARPRMVHLNAPGQGLAGGAGKSAHLPLTALDGEGGELGERLCASLCPGGVVVAEFFAWSHVEESLPVINRWFEKL